MKNDDAHYHNHLGNIALKNNQFDEALKHYAAALKIKPDLLEAHFNLGLLFQRQNKWEYAIKQFNNVLQLNENYDKALQQLADIYLQQEKVDLAITHYQRLLAINPKNIEAFNNLGVAFLKIKETKKAMACFMQVLALEPDHEVARNNLSEIATSLFDNYADHYDQHLCEALDYQVPKLLRDAILRIEPNKKFNILDLGCGTGLTGMAFSDLAKRLVGVDVSEKMLEQAAKKNIYDRLVKADINKLDQIKEKFDLIIAADVFVYVGNLQSIFSVSKSLLEPKGYFAFTVENLKDESINYLLQDTARFAHSKTYLKNLAQQFNFSIRLFETVKLRLQEQSEITGYLVVLQVK